MELDHLFQKDPCQTHIHVTLDDTVLVEQKNCGQVAFVSKSNI